MSYGRNATAPPGGVDQYQILFQSDDFPVSGRQAMKALSASVQWIGGGDTDRYGDCFALWPTDEQSVGVLVAKLTDAGKDRLGRPHALRVDAVYIDVPELASASDRLARLLTAAAWPRDPWSGPPNRIALVPSEFDPQVVKILQQFVTERRELPRVLVACHTSYRAQGFDWVLDPVAPSGQPPASPVAAIRTVAPPPHPSLATSTQSRCNSRIWRALLVMLFGVLGIAVWLGYEQYRLLATERDRLLQKFNAFQAKVVATEADRQRTATELVRVQRTQENQQRELNREAALRRDVLARLLELQQEMTEWPEKPMTPSEESNRANFIISSAPSQQPRERWLELLKQALEVLRDTNDRSERE